MSNAAPSSESFPTETDVDEVLAEFEGDPRAAIAALLRDLATLADDNKRSVSKGFTRGEMPDAPQALRLRRR